jgi:hypothetical protein
MPFYCNALLPPEGIFDHHLHKTLGQWLSILEVFLIVKWLLMFQQGQSL